MNYKDFFVGLLAGLVVVLGVLLFQSQGLSFGAQSNFSGPVNSGAGYHESGTTVIDTNGAWVNTVSSTAIFSHGGAVTFTGAGTVALNSETTLGNCGTATFTVPALAPAFATDSGASSIVTTTVSVTGLAENDVVLVGWDANSATTTLYGRGIIMSETASTSVAVVSFYNGSNATSTAFTSASGTITACYFD